MTEPFQIGPESTLNTLIVNRIRRALLDQDAATYHGMSFQLSAVSQDATGEIIRAVNEAIRADHNARKLEADPNYRPNRGVSPLGALVQAMQNKTD
jgi:hypothetical protein